MGRQNLLGGLRAVLAALESVSGLTLRLPQQPAPPPPLPGPVSLTMHPRWEQSAEDRLKPSLLAWNPPCNLGTCWAPDATR